jgi:hypothetical protein
MINSADIDYFEENGAVVLRNILSESEVKLLGEGVDKNLKNPSKRAIQTIAKDTGGLFIEDFCNWNNIGEYKVIVLIFTNLKL